MRSSKQKGRFADERRYSSKPTYIDGPPLLERPNPQSLTMGPDVIFRNALGEPEAVEMTNGWQGQFVVTRVNGEIEAQPWTL